MRQTNLLFFVDPLKKLNPLSDTSLALIYQAKKLGVEVFVATSEDLFWDKFKSKVSVARIKRVKKGFLPEIGVIQERPIDFFEGIFIRKDPPFDESYLRLCWLLVPFENKIKIVNKPSLLLRYHEKMLPLEGVVTGYLRMSDLIPSFMTASLKTSINYVNSLKPTQIILKPYLGYGGNKIRLFTKKDFKNKARLFFRGKEAWIIQEFEPKVLTEGDRRVFFLGGKYAGSFVRIPKKGSIVSNLAQGGSAVHRDLNFKEKSLIKRMEPWVKKLGFEFVGADFIAGRLNELNVTSPTGFLSYQRLYGKDLSLTLLRKYL